MGALPPLVGLAVKVTVWPLHTVEPALDAIVSEGTPFEVIVIVMPLEVAVAGEAQEAFEVSWQVITSLLANDDEE